MINIAKSPSQPSFLSLGTRKIGGGDNLWGPTGFDLLTAKWKLAVRPQLPCSRARVYTSTPKLRGIALLPHALLSPAPRWLGRDLERGRGGSVPTISGPHLPLNITVLRYPCLPTPGTMGVPGPGFPVGLLVVSAAQSRW